MHVTIGNLANNENANISRTIESLFEQSIFSGAGAALSDTRWEVLVVPNGCTDEAYESTVDALTTACAEITDGSRSDCDYSLVVRADNAPHYFEGPSHPATQALQQAMTACHARSPGCLESVWTATL